MRDFFNGILSFIGQSSLTDPEFAACESTLPLYDQGTYDDLAGVLESREAVSTAQERLVAYYTAKGVDVAANDTGTSNIFVGGVLCD